MSPRKQQQVPGTEPKTNKKVDKAAGTYVDCLYERMDLQDREAAAKTDLIHTMKEEKVKQYVYRDDDNVTTIKLILESKEKLSCRRKAIEED